MIQPIAWSPQLQGTQHDGAADSGKQPVHLATGLLRRCGRSMLFVSGSPRVAFLGLIVRHSEEGGSLRDPADSRQNGLTPPIRRLGDQAISAKGLDDSLLYHERGVGWDGSSITRSPESVGPTVVRHCRRCSRRRDLVRRSTRPHRERHSLLSGDLSGGNVHLGSH